MPALGFVLAVALAGGLSVLCIALARHFVRRGDAEGGWPWRLFATFWTGMAVYVGLDASWALGVAAGVVPLALSLAVLHVKIVAAVAAFFGLVAYLLYVYTGSPRSVRVVAFLYVAIFLVTVYFYVWRGPVGHHVTPWGASLDYAKPGGAFQQAVIVLLFLPPALAALAYAMLIPVTPKGKARLRVAVTCVSLFVLFAGLTLGWLNGKWLWWGLAEKVLALSAVSGVLWATTTQDRVTTRG